MGSQKVVDPAYGVSIQMMIETNGNYFQIQDPFPFMAALSIAYNLEISTFEVTKSTASRVLVSWISK